ncbi:MAG: hypothetical protein ABDI20_09550 [Candidatus Bipolaricaulaceae bacterium]
MRDIVWEKLICALLFLLCAALLTGCLWRKGDVGGFSHGSPSDLDKEASGGIAPSSVPTIQVLTPNGDEVWAIGRNHEIRWSSSRVQGNVRIDLSRDGGKNWTTIIANTPNDGAEVINVPAPESTAARVRIVSLQNPTVADISDKDFFILQPDKIVFRVSDENGAPLSGMRVTVLGSQGRTTSGTTDGRGLVVLATACSTTLVCDPQAVYASFIMSESYCRMPPALYSIVLRKRPQTGAQIVYRQQVNHADLIAMGYKVAAIFTYKELQQAIKTKNSLYRAIERTLAASHYTFGVPATIASVRSTDIEETDVNALYLQPLIDPITTLTLIGVGFAAITLAVEIYNTFLKEQPVCYGLLSKGDGNTIVTICMPLPRITEPNGGETWFIGEKRTIKWSMDKRITSVLIQISRDGGSTWTTIMQTQNDESEDWVVTGPATSNARMRVVAIDPVRGEVTEIMDMSDANFRIAERPTIRVSTPNGGETWAVGSTRTIRWISTGVTGNVRIDLSRDGGFTWVTIISNTPNDGTESWRVTGPATTRAKVRVVSINNPSISDESDANFTIR